MDIYNEYLQELNAKRDALLTHISKYEEQCQVLVKLIAEISCKKENLIKQMDKLTAIKLTIENPETQKTKNLLELKTRIKKSAKKNGILSAILGAILAVCTIISVIYPAFSFSNVGLANLVIVARFIICFEKDVLIAISLYNKKEKNLKKVLNENNLENVLQMIETLQKQIDDYEIALSQNQEQLTSLITKIQVLEEKMSYCHNLFEIVNNARNVAINNVSNSAEYESLINEQFYKDSTAKNAINGLSRILIPNKTKNKNKNG